MEGQSWWPLKGRELMRTWPFSPIAPGQPPGCCCLQLKTKSALGPEPSQGHEKMGTGTGTQREPSTSLPTSPLFSVFTFCIPHPQLGSFVTLYYLAVNPHFHHSHFGWVAGIINNSNKTENSNTNNNNNKRYQQL